MERTAARAEQVTVLCRFERGQPLGAAGVRLPGGGVKTDRNGEPAEGARCDFSAGSPVAGRLGIPIGCAQVEFDEKATFLKPGRSGCGIAGGACEYSGMFRVRSAAKSLHSCSSDMGRAELNDLEPGTPPEIRQIPGGALALLFVIAADYKTRTRDQLILRWEPDGQLFAAVARVPSAPEQG